MMIWGVFDSLTGNFFGLLHLLKPCDTRTMKINSTCNGSLYNQTYKRQKGNFTSVCFSMWQPSSFWPYTKDKLVEEHVCTVRCFPVLVFWFSFLYLFFSSHSPFAYWRQMLKTRALSTHHKNKKIKWKRKQKKIKMHVNFYINSFFYRPWENLFFSYPLMDHVLAYH